jgi:hypothetical protein
VFVFRYDYQYRVLAIVLVRLLARRAMNIDCPFPSYGSYLEVFVIGADFRHQQGKVAIFRSALVAPVGVTHNGVDYTTLLPLPHFNLKLANSQHSWVEVADESYCEDN